MLRVLFQGKLLTALVLSLFIYGSANADQIFFYKSVFRGQGVFNSNYNESLAQGCQYEEMTSCPNGFILENGKCYSEYFKSIVIFKYSCDSNVSNQVEYDEYETHTYSTMNQQDIITIAEQLSQNTRSSYCPQGTVYLGSLYLYQLEASSISDNQYTAILNVLARAYCRIDGTGEGGGSTGSGGDDYNISAIKDLLVGKLIQLRDTIMSNIVYRDVSIDDIYTIELYGKTITININSVPYINTIVNVIYYTMVLVMSIDLIRNN